MKERELLKKTKELLADDYLLYRNTVGIMRPINKLNVGTVVHVGLGKGSSDLIGYRKSDCKFTAVEVKREGELLSNEQKTFLSQIDKDGGIALVVRFIGDNYTIKLFSDL